MRRPIALSLVLACALLSGSARPETATPAQGDVRIATFNVNYGLAGDPATLEALAATEADVVFVQEANADWSESFRALGDRWPYQSVLDAPAAGGLAILSRYPFDEGRVIPSPVGWFPAWCTVVETPSGPLQVLQVHLHPPYDARGGWLLGPFTTQGDREAEIAVALDALEPGLPTAIVGDFNERAGRAVALAERAGFEDALPRFAPRARTWSWRTPVGRISATLDHVMAGGGARVAGAWVLDGGWSDHRPVVAEIDLP